MVRTRGAPMGRACPRPRAWRPRCIASLGLLALAVLVGCQSSEPAPVALVPPYGSWLGHAYVGESYVGAIAVDYGFESWVWCVTTDACYVGATSGWDLIDGVGDRMRGRYLGARVTLTYSQGPHTLHASLAPLEMAAGDVHLLSATKLQATVAPAPPRP
jgi:hypothetical protein